MTTPGESSGEQPVPTLSGVLVQLRAPRPADIQDRQRAGYQAEYRRMVGSDVQRDGPMRLEDAQRWYKTRCTLPYTWAIEWERRVIGLAFLHDVDAGNRRARFGIGIYDPACWGRGFGVDATVLVLGYAFELLKLHRVDLRVLSYNHRAIRAYTKVGFVQEGIEREGAWIAGQWESDVMMSILENEYRARYGKLPQTR
jgi:RimJ/RimL family protein N-acetyltransferase